jgi:hypothetical protein
METAEQKKLMDSLGLTEKQVKEYKEFKPWLKLSEVEVITLIIKTKTPYKIEFEDKKTGEKKTIMALDVNIEGDNFIYVLPLSATTLRMGLINIMQRHKFDLTDVKVSIKRSVVEFKKFGENNCYRVQEVE